ncbi:unnamed protein product [Caenorhabditis bovis]|uniref:SCP2 domain-containing protein n=1 Tax=Caenorhabditis bovis TaxID=2654633 RepID=A0A8S1EV00_9PELO|nr:unnamed protein product [Caenorhabditis bovis]
MPSKELSSNFIFGVMRSEIEEGKNEALEKIKGVIEIRITVEGIEKLVFTFDLRSRPGIAKREKLEPKPDAMMTIEDENFVKICSGDLDPVQAFIMRKFVARGDFLLMQNIVAIIGQALRNERRRRREKAAQNPVPEITAHQRAQSVEQH